MLSESFLEFWLLLAMNSLSSFDCSCQIWSPEDGDLGRYQYSPLPEGQDIRILRLEPGDFEDLLLCSLEPLAFGSDFEEYEALSYTWGDGLKNHTLLTPSQSRLGITSNLHTALHYLRDSKKAIYIWIDAICINQESIAERNQQVLRMGEVYSKAYNVTVWIGDEYEDSKEAFGLIHGYEAAAKEGENAVQTYIRSLRNRQEEPCRMALWQLLNSPWFKRIWIIQEVVLAMDIEVVCGESYCTWNGLAGLVIGLAQHGLTVYLGTNGGKRLLTIDSLRNNFYQSREELDLGYLLGKTRHFQSNIPHDKIYGLAALLQKEDQDNLVVNYELPVATFYKRVVVSHIKSRWNFDVLYMGGYLSQPSSLSMPTWGCDWSLDIGTRDVLPLSVLSHDAGKPFNCGGTTESDMSVDDSGQVLIVIGYKFDGIAKLQTDNLHDLLQTPTVNPQLGFNVNDVDFTVVWSKLKLMKLFAQKSLPYPDDLDLSSVWSRLLVYNQGLNEKVEPSESYFQMSYRLFETGISRCDAAGYISEARKAEDIAELQPIINKVNNCEDPEAVKLQAIGYGLALGGLIGNRKLCLTDGRYLGWAPLITQEGDIIATFKGAKLSFVLRPVHGSADGSFIFIGECYVHGIMYGEAIEKGNIEEQTFRIY